MNHQTQAAINRPEGYERVRYGRIRPDDLVWSIGTLEFLPANDPSWLMMVEFASDAEYVIRKSDRKPKPDTEAEVLMFAQQGQQGLF